MQGSYSSKRVRWSILRSASFFSANCGYVITTYTKIPAQKKSYAQQYFLLFELHFCLLWNLKVSPPHISEFFYIAENYKLYESPDKPSDLPSINYSKADITEKDGTSFQIWCHMPRIGNQIFKRVGNIIRPAIFISSYHASFIVDSMHGVCS